MSKKAELLFPKLLIIARERAQLYLKNNRDTRGMIANMYFRAAYGLESVSFYELMVSDAEVGLYDNFERP